jgi:tRNA-specific adenosine deaminase 1
VEAKAIPQYLKHLLLTDSRTGSLCQQRHICQELLGRCRAVVMEAQQDDGAEQGAVLFSALMRVYDALPPGGKPREDEYTVLAAIVARVDGVKAPRYRVLSLATGTKCIGADVDNKEGHLLGDSHAEVLARRGLAHFLLACVMRCIREEAWLQSEDCPLELVGTGGSGSGELGTRGSGSGAGCAPASAPYTSAPLQLKRRWALHLYISDPPCGDACIYPSRQTAFTGAKAVPLPNHTHPPHPPYSPHLAVGSTLHGTGEAGESGTGAAEVLGCLRTKSGRSDIRAQSRTTSMSCSDKVCRWAALGLQG